MNITNEEKWVIGLIEADGYIGFNHNGNKKWIVMLKVSLNKYNARAIYKLKKIMGYGKIHKSGDMIIWKITKRDIIKNKIIPMLEKFNFRGSKYYDMEYLKDAIEILESSKNINEKHEMLIKLKILSKNNSLRISKVVFSSIKNYNQKSDKELINLISLKKINELIDPWWLAGFIEGDGSFYINNKLQVIFEIGQKYNTFVIWLIHKYLKIENKIKIRKDKSYTVLSIKKKKDIEFLIKLLNKKLLGIKSFEFNLWCKVFKTKKKNKKENIKKLLERIRKNKKIIYKV